MHSPIRQDSPLSIYDETAIAASNLEMIDKQQRSLSPEVPQTNLYKNVNCNFSYLVISSN